MMQFLETLAQIAVSLLGFSALLVTLAPPEGEARRHFHEARMSLAVLLPLMVLGLSLVPFPLIEFGLSERTVWRGMAAVLLVGGKILQFRDVRRNRLHGGLRSNDAGAQYVLWLAVSLGLDLLLLASIIGWCPGREFAIYLTVLVAMLIGSAHLLWVSYSLQRSEPHSSA